MWGVALVACLLVALIALTTLIVWDGITSSTQELPPWVTPLLGLVVVAMGGLSAMLVRFSERRR